MAEINNYEEYLVALAGLNFKLPNTGATPYKLTQYNVFLNDGVFRTITPIDTTSSNAIPTNTGQNLFNLFNYFDADGASRDAEAKTLFERLYTGSTWHAGTTQENLIGARTDYESFFDTLRGLTFGGNPLFPSAKIPYSVDTYEMAIAEAWKYYTGVPLDPSTSGLGALAYLSDGSNSPATNALLQQDPLTGNYQLLTDEEFAQLLLEQNFSYFLRNYNWPQVIQPVDTYARQFWLDWQRFLAARTTIDESGAPQLAQGVNIAVDYRDLYNAFVPGGSEEDFRERLVSVYREVTERDGYFNPNHHLKDWLEEVQTAATFNSGRISPVAGNSSERVRVLMRLFILLVEMIDVLQRVTAAQADRLKFYAEYQKAYTQIIALVPLVDLKTIEFVEADANERSNLVNQLQATTGGWTETLRGYRSALGDEAKQHQTAVNQSNEIVNQQAQLGTSILQQMSTILTTIFK